VARSLFIALCALPLFGANNSLDDLLNSVERHYNSVRTLQVEFRESYHGAGRPQRSESGQLFLRKPGQMRWQYSQPAGKLFISDGKQVYYYNPVTNRAERVKMKETEDLRAPLAFLLGRLDFQKDFKDFRNRTEGLYTVVSANPKSDRLPYKEVEFFVTAQNEIQKLNVTGQDNAMLSFEFLNERMNPRLDADLFKFRLPPGAQWLESGQSGEGGQ
jgi:outer membrane lipoprotein carrier protein